MSLWKLFQSFTPSAGRRKYNLITSSISQTPAQKTRSRLKQINCERTRVYIISAHRRITEVVLSQSPSVCSACKLWCSPKKGSVQFFFFCFLVFFVFFVCLFLFTSCNMLIRVLLTTCTHSTSKLDVQTFIPSCDQWLVAFFQWYQKRLTSDPKGLMLYTLATHCILVPNFGTVDCEPWL